MKKTTWFTLLITFMIAAVAFAGMVYDTETRGWKGVQTFFASSPIVFEGATENAYQTTVAITDPTADRTLTVPNATGALVLSSLTTNAADAANSVWGASNALVFEGATANAYETSIVPTDPTADRTITLPNSTGTVELVEAKLSETVTATNALTAAECGKTMFLNSATEFATTLPAISTVSAGCQFKFIVVGAPSGASYTIISGNSLENVITGGVVERETDTGDDGPYQADGDTITIVDGLAVAGDYLELISDGSKYYLHGQVNADGAVTVAQAD